MIYYLMILTLGVLIDIKDLKESEKKTDIIFYTLAIIVCILLGVFYFTDANRSGAAELLIKWFGLGGK